MNPTQKMIDEAEQKIIDYFYGNWHDAITAYPVKKVIEDLIMNLIKRIEELQFELNKMNEVNLQRIRVLEEGCQKLEWDHAEAMTLVLNHEGHIEKLEKRIIELNSSMTCSVCMGKPLESKKECICGGTGTEWGRADGLTKEVFNLNKRIDELEEALQVQEDKYDDLLDNV